MDNSTFELLPLSDKEPGKCGRDGNVIYYVLREFKHPYRRLQMIWRL